MRNLSPPVVFVGPSASIEEARAVLPQAEYRPPAARGDLYRARFAGASILVLIDGVFFQSYAPSPREVVEVLRDGACVLGAASLGALRASECWPVGMLGAGLIYRLFRAGRLHSDEEVAVAFDPHVQRPLSVPLVNVRYSTHCAVKACVLDRRLRDAIVRAAADIFYTDRTWNAIFASAPFEISAQQQRFVESIDLKKLDALLALSKVAHWLRQDPLLVERHIRQSSEPFIFTQHVREPDADPVAGVDKDAIKRELARWLLTSGRFRRYFDASVEAGPDMKEKRELVSKSLADFDGFAASLWSELTRLGERDAELFRWRAVQQIAEESGRPLPIELYQAELELLAEHGLQTWDDLEHWAASHHFPCEWFRGTRERTARARRRANELFSRRPI